MERNSLIDFWARQAQTNAGWCHSEDAPLLAKRPHSFNLNFPVSPYVGNVLGARVLILNANAGYNPATTPSEFRDTNAIAAYLSRVASPSTADWTTLHQYYNSVNYGHLIPTGQAALVNCCAYRSPSISKEKDNRTLIKDLPSCAFTRQWLQDVIIPLARRGELKVVAKRYGLWNINHLRGAPGVIFDPAPVSPHLAQTVLAEVHAFLNDS